MTKEDRFYDQANTAYTIGGYKVIGDMFSGKEAGWNAFFMLTVFLPVMLIIWLVRWIKNQKPTGNTGSGSEPDPWDPVFRAELLTYRMKATQAQKNAIIKNLNENRTLWEEEDPYFAPAVESFDDLDTLEEMDNIRDIMTDSDQDKTRATLRWLLSLSEKELNDKLNELDALAAQKEIMSKTKSRKAYKKLVQSIKKNPELYDEE